MTLYWHLNKYLLGLNWCFEETASKEVCEKSADCKQMPSLSNLCALLNIRIHYNETHEPDSHYE